jgi:tetratricopeptide (TPR) repeat protein
VSVKTRRYSGVVFSVALLLLAACASSPPARTGDPELSSLSRAGRDAFARGEYKLSARLYRMARDRARLIDEPGEIGTVTYNLAAAYLELGETERAEDLLEEARRAFSRGLGVPPDLILLQGRVALFEGRIGEAEKFIEEGLTAGEKDLEGEIRIQFQLLRGRTALAGGSPEAARKIYRDLRGPMKKIEDDILTAEYLSLEGELLFLEGDFLRAGEVFDREAALLRKAGRYRGMTRARKRAGSAYLEAGEFCPAGDRFYRTARSLAARGETVAALEAIQSALQAAENCPEETLREEVGFLFVELKEALEEKLPSVPPAESE